MNENLSEPEREKRAREVYKSAFWNAYFVGLAIYIALILISIPLESWLRTAHSNSSSYSGWMGGIGVLPVFGAYIWAFKSLRRAGLLHEELEIIVRNGDVAAGETIEFYYPKTVWGKLALILFFVAIGAASWWLWQYQNERFFGALGILMSIVFVILSLRSFNLPNARVDDRGVFGYVYGSGLWPRLVRWDEIGGVQIERISGWPLKKERVLETIILKNAAGKTVMTLTPNTFSGALPELKQRFVAEIKRRLTSDETM